MYNVLIMSVLVLAAALGWHASFVAANTHASRDPDRARARAVAEAAVVRACLLLERGAKLPAHEAILDGEASFAISNGAAGSRHIIIDGKIERARTHESIVHRIVLDVRVDASKKVHVLERREVGE